MFKITRDGSGFHIKFENNIVLSVQFGWGTYSDNEDYYKYEDCLKDKFGYIYSSNCEVAIWRKTNGKDDWITDKMIKDLFPDEYPYTVLGYVSPDRLAKIIDWCVKRSKTKEIK